MAQAAMAAQVVGAVAGGISALNKGRAEKETNEINAYIGETRAKQTSASAADALASEMATMRATIAGNGQKLGVGTMGIFGELRRIRSRESRIAVQNEMQGASDFRRQGRNAMAEARGKAFGSFLGAVEPAANLYDYRAMLSGRPSLFDLYQQRRGA